MKSTLQFSLIIIILLISGNVMAKYKCPKGTYYKEGQASDYHGAIEKYCDLNKDGGKSFLQRKKYHGKRTVWKNGKLLEEQWLEKGKGHGAINEYDINTGKIKKVSYMWRGHRVSTDRFKCNKGNSDNCYSIAISYLKNREEIKGKKILNKWCEKKHENSCNKLTKINRGKEKIEGQRQARIKKRDQHKIMENSPECKSAKLAQSYCYFQALMQTQQNVIKREKEAGEISGYVDKIKLNGAAKGFIYSRDRAELTNSDYQKITNKSLNRDFCQIKNGRGVASANYKNPQIEEDRKKYCGNM